jgi:hypothetical protein
MPATIGDAMVQLGNFSLEAVGKLDEAAKLSQSISGFIISGLAGLRAAYMPNEQEQFNALLVERVALEERLAALNTATNRSRAEPLSEGIRAEIAAINEKMIVLRDANVERQKAEHAAQAEGVSTRAATEAQRVVDHQAELARIQAEKDAKIRAEEESRAIIRGMKQGGKLGGAEGIILEIEAKKKQQDELLRMTFDWQRVMDAEAAASDQKRIDASASQTEQLISFQNLLLANKSETSRAAATIGMNLINQEKREAAKKIITDSYAAAMSAYKALAGIPIIGPALGAVAAGGIIAAGVSYSAKSLAGRALGGQTLAGESYVVGERGPEVLTMGATNGKIIPNSSLPKSQTSGTVNKTANVSFNITANDARGFDQMLNSSRGKIIDIINLALNDNGREAIA